MLDYVRRILTSSVYQAAEETPLEKMQLLSARLGADVLQGGAGADEYVR